MKKTTPLPILALLAAGCPVDDETTPPEEEMAAEESSTGDEANDEILALYDCADVIQEVGPLAGPGYDPQEGLLEPVQDTYIAATTQIVVKDEEQMTFLQLVADIGPQLETAEGFVGYALAIEPNCGFYRTVSLWRSEADMYRFVGTGPHAKAMGQTAVVAVTGKTTSWEIPAAELPLTWDMARAQLADVEPLATY